MQVLRQEITGKLKIKAFLTGVFFFGAFLLAGSVWAFQQSFQNRFYPGVLIDGVDISGLTQTEVFSKLSNQNEPILEQTVTLVAGEQSIASSTAQLGLHREYDQAIADAFQIGRNKGAIKNAQEIVETYFSGKQIKSQLAFDPLSVQEFVTALAVRIHSDAQLPQAILKSGHVEIFPGKVGQGLVIEDMVKNILLSANAPQLTFTANLQPVGIQLTAPQITEAQIRTEKFVGKSLEGKVDIITVNVSDSELVAA